MDTVSQAIALLPIDRVINWKNLSSESLSDTFIDENHAFLDWNVISQTQALAPWIAHKYRDRVNFENLSSNKNLPRETIVACIDKMDIEMSQQYHHYDDDMVMTWKDHGILDPMILIEYQKLIPSTVRALAQPYADTQQWGELDLFASIASQYQVLDTGFYDWLLQLESANNNDHLFDRHVLLQYQKLLPEQWVLKNIVKDDLQLRTIMLENFPVCDMTVLTSMVNNPEIVNYHKILKVQKLREAVLYYILELQKTDELALLRKMIKHQVIDTTFLVNTTKKLSEQNAEFVRDLYNIAFLRTICPKHADFLPWQEDFVKRTIVPFLGMDRLAATDLTDYFPEFVQFITKNVSLFTQFSWYRFISNNRLNDETLEILEPVLNPLEYWYALTKNKKSLTKTIWTRELPRLNWWAQIPSALLLDFSSRCLECPETSDLYCLLTLFVNSTKWSEFFNYERLPEWLIETLVRFRPAIERQMHNVSFWWKVGRFQKLSHAFIDAHSGDLELKNILIYQTLSPAQLERYEAFYDDECWRYIVKYQAPSEEFLYKYDLAIQGALHHFH